MSRIYNWFIPEDFDLIELTRAKTIVSLLFVSLLVSIILLPLKQTINTDFPMGIMCVGIISLLALYKWTASNDIIGNLTVLIFFVAIVTTTFKSGGIYSRDLAGIFLVMIISLSVSDVRYTAFWTMASLGFVSYMYVSAQDPGMLETYKLQIDAFPVNYYLVTNVAFIILPTVFVFILASLNAKLIKNLRITNAELDRSNGKLFEETQKLSNTKLLLESSNQKLERYAYAASHDLKQPIRTISSFTQLLSMRLKKLGMDDGKISDYIYHVESGAKRMDIQLEELLSYSKVNSNDKINLHNVNDILNDVLQDLKSQLDSEQVKIDIDTMPDIMVRRSNMSQVFQNLISNAVKYKKPEVPLLVNITANDNKNEWIFCIKDNGIGIEKDKLEYIFDAFTQTHETNSGLGIGLSTCKEIVENYNGQIWVESDMGIGSQFYFSFPKTIEHVNNMQAQLAC